MKINCFMLHSRALSCSVHSYLLHLIVIVLIVVTMVGSTIVKRSSTHW